MLCARHDYWEITMNVFLKATIALGSIVIIPSLAVPALGAATTKTMRKPAHYQVFDFANAQAFVNPVTPVLRARETDGLGRSDEECNTGCIDH
jgi:hypothetical protein